MNLLPFIDDHYFTNNIFSLCYSNVGELSAVGNRYGDEDNVISPWLHFQGLGIGPNIPVYLRVNGNVCNLNFSKKECEIYVNDIWVAKAEFEASLRLKNKDANPEDDEDDADSPENMHNNKIHLSDYFKIFLEVGFSELNFMITDLTCVFYLPTRLNLRRHQNRLSSHTISSRL